jgi:outer membrane lipoprotein-sorting protein
MTKTRPFRAAALAATIALAWAAAPAAAVPDRTQGAPVVPALSAEQIVDRSIAARGGLATWQGIDSLAWVGHIESERLGQQAIKFSLEEKRPNKTRFDITGSQPSVRIFDGHKGWKVHSRNDGLPEVESYSPFEERYALEAPGLGGPLITYRSQNRPIELAGRDQLDGRGCYVLAVMLPSGGRQLVWVDAETWLEQRLDRPTYNHEGKAGMVSVYYRNYKSQAGLQVPTVIEIGGGPDQKRDRLVIERLAINPDIAETRFTKPPSPPHSHEITLPAMAPPAAPRPAN